jgi:flagellar secretion chaperone FliS
MQLSNSIKSYTRIAANTAPPGVLILMLFDRALRALDTALAGFEYSDPRERNETIHNNLRRAIDIIRFLNSSLNLQEGGELAQTLRNLYVYFDGLLVKSNLRKHRDGVDEVIGHLKPLRDSWAEMLNKQGEEQVQEEEVVAA